jgi:hypothetical protein
METANIMLALGGDPGNTIPKFGVTASEIAVLQAIHGNEAVTDILPTGKIERKSREELGRLHRLYGKSRAENSPHTFVEILFPGAAARVFTTLEELEIDESFYKAEKRAKPTKAEVAAVEQEKPLTKAEIKERKAALAAAKAAAAGEPAPEPEAAEPDAEDIADEHTEDADKPLFAN